MKSTTKDPEETGVIIYLHSFLIPAILILKSIAQVS